MAIEAQMAKWMNDIDEECRKKYGCKPARRSSSELACSEGIEEQTAAHLYTESQLKNVDSMDGAGYPMWYGWAIRHAFEKGIEWERSRSSNVRINDCRGGDQNSETTI